MLYIGSYQDGWASWKVQECFFFPFVKYLQTFRADFHFYNHLQFSFYDACCSSCTKVRQLTGKLEPPDICWFQFHWSSRAKAVGSVATAQLCRSHSQHPPQKRNSQSRWTVTAKKKNVKLHFHIDHHWYDFDFTLTFGLCVFCLSFCLLMTRSSMSIASSLVGEDAKTKFLSKMGQLTTSGAMLANVFQRKKWCQHCRAF